LAHAVFAYSANIDDLGNLSDAIKLIAHKHVSLNVQPDEYPLIGEQLLLALKDVLERKLHKELSRDLLAAWAAAYDQLADVFIRIEEKLYDDAAAQPGGWRGWKKFQCTNRIAESEDVMSFDLAPADGAPCPSYPSGAFISV
jgi:nitric oxide dioxygenase